MRRLQLLLLAIVVSTSVASAQGSWWKRGAWDQEHRHAASFSVGSYPAVWRFVDYNLFSDVEPTPDFGNKFTTDQLTFKKSEVTTPSFDIAYSYRFDKTLSLEIVAAYVGQRTNYNNIYTDRVAVTSRSDIFLLMPNLRAHWYNTKRLSLYSSLAIGAGIANRTNIAGEQGNDEVVKRITTQLSIVGANLYLGQFYIFGEMGVGSLGSRLGAGYRF